LSHFTSQVPHEAALVQDAVQLFFNALEIYSEDNDKLRRTKHFCNKPNTKSKNGFELAEFMKTQEFEGVTGKVEINSQTGRRTEFRLDILELSSGEFSKIGFWDTTGKLNLTDRQLKDSKQQTIEKIQHKRFKIVVKLGRPFLMERNVSSF
jgi:Receptor family ligand binding region